MAHIDGRAIATAFVWLGVGFVSYITKSADHVGWGVGATFLIWWLGS